MGGRNSGRRCGRTRCEPWHAAPAWPRSTRLLHPRQSQPQKREWRLALLPAATVRGRERQAGEGETPFLGAGSGRGLAAPVGSLSAFHRSRSFSGSPGWPDEANFEGSLWITVRRTCRISGKPTGRTPSDLPRVTVEANFDDFPFARPSPEGSGCAGHLWKVGSARACAFTSRFFVQMPGQSLLRLSSLRRSAASAVATAFERVFRFRKTVSPAAKPQWPWGPIRPSGISLWIRRITGIIR
jgi:hypothetical protein